MVRRQTWPLLLVGAALALGLAAAGALVLVLVTGPVAETADADLSIVPAHPAADDVEVTSCDVNSTGHTRASGIVTNRSSETSDYAIHLFSAPHDEVTYVRRLEPSSSRVWTVTSDEVAAEPTNCSARTTRGASQTIDGLCEQVHDDPRLRQAAINYGEEGVDVLQLCGVDAP